MRKKEILRKFDEIVDFSGVERYIDTPVKRYSSGMYVRLAFAVAAHLESEILIVDEVLAVGDAEFQEKCLGKMNDVSIGEGRTILFVSHNIIAVKQLCKRGIVLQNGSIKFDGLISDAVEEYSVKVSSEKEFSPFKIDKLGLVVTSVKINNSSKNQVSSFEPFRVDIEIDSELDTTGLGIQIMLYQADAPGMMFASNTKTTDNIDVKLTKGKNTITFHIDKLNLCAGKYWLGFGIDQPFIEMYYYEPSLISFDVQEEIVTPRLLSNSSAYGRVYLDHSWNIINND